MRLLTIWKSNGCNAIINHLFSILILLSITSPITWADEIKCTDYTTVCAVPTKISEVSELFLILGPASDIGSGLFVYSFKLCGLGVLTATSSNGRELMAISISHDQVNESLIEWQAENCAKKR